MSLGIFDPILRSILEPRTVNFGVIFSVIYWTSFWTLFGTHLGPFWGPFWDQIGPRRGEDRPQRATKSFPDPKSCICKNIQKQSFSKFLGSRGLPREAPEAHEGSQEAPKELQDLKNKGSKNEPEKNHFLTNFGPILEAILGSEWAPKLVPNCFFFGACFWTSFC